MASKKTSLLQIIEDQKQEIEKYKSKLRDIVTAHRSLIKEKNALEESLKAIRDGSISSNSNEDGVQSGVRGNETEDAKQITALVNSLATLSATKAQMEASFQADKKKLREDKERSERRCDELLNKLTKYELDIEEWKKRLIVERHERDKEQIDHGAIMKELQNVLASERNARMGLEETITTLKKQLADGSEGSNIERQDRKIERLKNELEITRRKLELAEKKGKEPPRELSKLQDEIRNLQVEHQMALQEERRRAEDVEERAKRQALIQEERVMNLETKLSDLSAIVGTYDRLRQQDQSEIIKLKEHIAVVNTMTPETPDNRYIEVLEKCEVDEAAPKDMEGSQKFEKHDNNRDLHAPCVEELLRIQREFEQFRKEVRSSKDNGGKDVDELVKSLQERIRLLNEEVTLKERQHKADADQHKLQLRTEKARFKETLAAAEIDFRSRLNLLETQLQKLRERSLALLEDKEQEIHSLQGTFQAFLPGARQQEPPDLPALTTMRDGPRMLHYANELARRDVELASLRRAKHKLEATLRDIQRAVIADAEKHREERQALREEIARLERCQTREGANLEYLKNVVLSFLLSNDPCSKRHMCNAIAAVLKFSENEQEKIGKQSHNSWWTLTKT